MEMDRIPLELQFKIKVLEQRWNQSSESQRLDILINLLNENFVLHSELTRRDKQRKQASVELPPLPVGPKPDPKKELPIGFCFDLWRLTVAVWWGERQ